MCYRRSASLRNDLSDFFTKLLCCSKLRASDKNLGRSRTSLCGIKVRILRHSH